MAGTLNDAIKNFARQIDDEQERLEKLQNGFEALQFLANRNNQLEAALTAAGIPLPPLSPPQGQNAGQGPSKPMVPFPAAKQVAAKAASQEAPPGAEKTPES